MADTEGVGWDDLASASVKISEDDYPITWVTAWSRFEYSLLGHESGRDSWVYVGAEHGFLSQNLLMDLPDVQIQCVEGTYGVFEGAKALEEYKVVKDGWYREMSPFYQVMRDKALMPDDNGHGLSRWLVCQWEFAHRRGEFERVFQCGGGRGPGWKFDPVPWGGPYVQDDDSKGVILQGERAKTHRVLALNWGGHKMDLSVYDLESIQAEPVYKDPDMAGWFLLVPKDSPVITGDILPLKKLNNTL